MEKILNNNSNEMKTHVETFIVEETASLIYDNEQLDKWNEKILELGLDGQTKIIQKEKSPIPFLWMNKTLINVFETLCPKKVDIKDYDNMPIPVEILDLVALSRNEKYFDCIEIWYDDENPDPACIGYVYSKTNESDWWRKASGNKYLIGKWSDVKASFSELIERAKIRFKSAKEVSLKQSIRSNQRELEDLDLEVHQRFGVNVTKVTDDLPF